MLRNCELSFDQFERIKSYCDSVQIEFSSTPFCLESSDFLSSLELDVVKVASFHLENKVLLRHLFENTSFTTYIVSTGMSTPQSIDSCIKLFNQYASHRDAELVFLHCVSQYPVVNISDYNLSNIPYLSSISLSNIVGFSDHTLGTEAAKLAVCLGASVIEKHFSIDNTLPGADHSMSCAPSVFSKLVNDCESAYQMLGNDRTSGSYTKG